MTFAEYISNLQSLLLPFKNQQSSIINRQSPFSRRAAAPPSTCLGKPADAGIRIRATFATHHRPRAGHSISRGWIEKAQKTALHRPVWLALGHAHHRGCLGWSDRGVLRRPAEGSPIPEIQSQDRWLINLERAAPYLLNCSRDGISDFPHKSHFFTA